MFLAKQQKNEINLLSIICSKGGNKRLRQQTCLVIPQVLAILLRLLVIIMIIITIKFVEMFAVEKQHKLYATNF